jgi:hypothetical protein
MVIVERANGKRHLIKIEPLTDQDNARLTKSRYFFDWKTEKENETFKLLIRGSNEILGVMSLIEHEDRRVQINLLAVSKENRGKGKVYEGISGNLIAWACREAVKRFGGDACVSLVPKTRLKNHYKKQYGMLEAGISLFLSDEALLQILKRFKL